MLSRLASFMLIAATSSAMAAGATIGGQAVNLPPPAGFCELSASNASDRNMIDTIGGLLAKSGNKLLSMSADCRQLKDWHVRKRQLLDDFAQYQTPIAQMDKPPSESIQQTCATLRAEGNKILSNTLPDIKARVEATLKKTKLNQTNFIGVVAEDPDACYAGLVQQLHTEVGTDKAELALFATTIVKGKTIFAYRFAVNKGSETVVAMLAKLKVDVAALYAANK